MLEVSQTVAVAMDDNRGVLNMRSINRTTVEPVWGSPTHGLGEAEGQETNSSHESENDADKAHLLSPSTLLLRTAKTWWDEANKIRKPSLRTDGDKDIPHLRMRKGGIQMVRK